MLDRRLLLALTLLAAGAPQVLAGTSPAIQEDELADDGWVGLAFEGTGGSGQATLDVAGSTPLSVGLLLLNGHEQPAGPSAFVVPDGSPGERLRVQHGPIDVDVDARRGSGTLALTATWTWAGFADAVTVVAWVAGDVAQANYTVDAGPEATLLDRTEGSGSFLLLDADLGSGLEWWNRPFPARATLADHTRTIGDAFVGFFDHGQGSWDAMAAQTPQGYARCPCAFAGAGPGEYTFEAAGAGAGTQGSLVLGGADVLLPAPAR